MRALFLLFAISGFLTLACPAQLPPVKSVPKGIAGNFYVSVDDHATVFVDGKQILDAGLNESRSDELALAVGQRIVVQVRNDLDVHRFMLGFLSSDKGTLINFKHGDFRIVPDVGVTDFTPAQFLGWTKSPQRQGNIALQMPIKCHSEWVWGDGDRFIVACTITPDMIERLPR